MKYSYEITPRPAELGDGWTLTLLQDSEEVGGGVFPIAQEGPHTGMEWWNGLAEAQRAHWLMMAASARPADAYHAYQLAEAYADAEATAYEWLDSRDERSDA